MNLRDFYRRPADPERCPKCGQARYDERLVTDGLMEVTTMDQAPLTGWMCLACNHRWAQGYDGPETPDADKLLRSVFGRRA
jgi:ribosomal protein L37AE/L43A